MSTFFYYYMLMVCLIFMGKIFKIKISSEFFFNEIKLLKAIKCETNQQITFNCLQLNLHNFI